MNIANPSKFLLTAFTLSLLLTATQASAQVYKVIDKDGNVTYTDQAPMDGSAPIELRPISVIEAPTYQKAPAKEEDAEDEKGMSLSYLRKNYKDFAIVSPQSEESVWKPDGPIAIAWNAGYALQEGMKVTIILDGTRQSSTTQQIVPVADLDRGEHVVSAELTDAKNRLVAKAVPVTFFVRQPGLYNRALNAPPAVTPNNGG